MLQDRDVQRVADIPIPSSPSILKPDFGTNRGGLPSIGVHGYRVMATDFGTHNTLEGPVRTKISFINGGQRPNGSA